MGINKIITITGVSCIAAGLAVGTAAFAASGFDKDVLLGSDDYEKVEFTENEEYSSIKVDSISENVVIRLSPDDQTHIEGWDTDDMKITVTIEDGQLTIKQKDTRKWYNKVMFNFSIFTSDKDLIIEVPYDEFVRLDIDTTSGDVEVPDFLTVEELAIDTTSGDVITEAVVTGSVNIDVTSGDITIRNAACNEIEADGTSSDISVYDSTCNELSLDTTSGDLLIQDCVVAGEAEMDTTSGDITIRRSTAASFDTDTTSGDVDYEN